MIVSPQAPKQLPQLKQLKGVLKAHTVLPNQTGVAGSSGYTPKAGDEGKFAALHKISKHEDRVGNKDDVFKAAKIKTYDRVAHRHGYGVKDDDLRGEFTPRKSPVDKTAASAINPAPVVVVKGISQGMSSGEGSSFGEDFTEENIMEDRGREAFLKVRGVSYERYQQMNPNEKKAFNLQYQSWAKAANKIRKEETELNEISKALAGRYIKKATPQLSGGAFRAGKAAGRGLKFTADNIATKALKRKAGIEKAADKISGDAKVKAS